jgi:hypothetical protein
MDTRPYIECVALEDVVGRKNVTVATGYYEVVYDSRVSRLASSCAVGYFGNTSELCASCYVGSVCYGREREPVSLAGFFIGNMSLESRSDACKHPTRTRCLAPRPCDPPESCIGEDLCSKPYMSKAPLYRCASCSQGYYRLAGKCRKCPDNPWILVVSFVVIVLVVAVMGYILNRKSVNIAFLSIGVDYFQVLAMFSRSNVKWPQRTSPLPSFVSPLGCPASLCATAAEALRLGLVHLWLSRVLGSRWVLGFLPRALTCVPCACAPLWSWSWQN